MHRSDPSTWTHTHVYVLGHEDQAMRRTIIVLLLTLLTMGAEIVAGTMFNSMALLADGWHMSTHACALGIAAAAYAISRRYAHNRNFTFGTGKVSSLAAFLSAVLLAIVAVAMIWESVQRLLTAQQIAFDQALLVAVVGLLVNLFSALILGGGHDHHHHDHHDHDHHDHGHHQDHNLHAAYMHVVADALTSLLAIVALLLGKYLGWWWMDPMMGIVGALVIGKWTVGLLRTSGAVLLDYQDDHGLIDEIHQALEGDEDVRLVDLHVWQIAAGHWAAIVSLVGDVQRSPTYYKSRLESVHELSHISIEVHLCPTGPSDD